MSALLGTPREVAPYLILDALATGGWTVSIVASAAGVRVRAARGDGLEAEETGDDVESVALLLATQCARLAGDAEAIT